ncbi:MAG: hypothetical protein HN741_11290 [Anaerolineae bacterium]|jgi:hypothetical protein|nr:hypothetical protein [Anaerolineae bacterium]
MSISRADKERLKKYKKSEIQNLLYDKDLLVTQRQSAKKIQEINLKISKAKKELKAIDALPEKDSSSATNIIVNGGNINQINTGTNIGDANQYNDGGSVFWNSIDYKILEKELSSLHLEMKKRAKTDDQDIALAEIAKAKKAAKEKNIEKIIEALKSAGKWALDVATKIGTTLVAEALKIAFGLK